MPAQRSQRSTRPAARAGTTTARRGNDGNGDSRRDNFEIAVCSRCACILPEGETSQRLHTIWHETVLRIDSRTAR
jgi:ribosomal protein S10